MKEITLKIKPDFTKYVNVNRWFSYPCNFYIIIGGRGIGKTTGMNIHNVGSYIKSGSEFVYCRRYITELKKAKSLLNPLVNDVKTQGMGNGLVAWNVKGVRLGYGVALTGQQTLKSGVDFTKCDVLVFDEAILPTKGSYKYLPNEVEMLFELISTVFRDRKNYKVFILGNNADIFNPYFAYFNIPRFERQYIDRERGIYCELCQNSPALLEAESQTPLYKLTKGTTYGDYHYDNKVLIKSNAKIGVKSPKAKLACRFVYNDFTINFYRQNWNDWFVELRDKKIVDDKSYVLFEDNKPNYLYIDRLRKDDVGKLLSICFYENYITYESDKASTLMEMVMEVL